MKTFADCLKINDQHDNAGRFASAGGAGGHDTPSKWLSTRAAKRALDQVVVLAKDPATYRKAMGQAVSTAIYHYGQMDQGPLQETVVHHEIEHLAQNLKISAIMAKDLMVRGVNAMIDARTRQVAARSSSNKSDPVLAALLQLKSVLDAYGVEKANDSHDEQGRFASGRGSERATDLPMSSKYSQDKGNLGALVRAVEKAQEDGSIGTKNVKLSDLRATQDYLGGEGGGDPVFEGLEEHPVVVDNGREKLLLDGHHRTSAAIANGDTKITVYYVNLKGATVAKTFDDCLKSNDSHDEHGRFASGDGGSGGGERDASGNQLTSDEHNEFVYAVQSTTDLDGSISDELTESLSEMSDKASELRDALTQMNDHEVDDEDGDTQEEAADTVRATYDAMKEFIAASEKASSMAAQAVSDAKTALVEFEKYMKESGIAKAGSAVEGDNIVEESKKSFFEIVKVSDEQRMVYGWASVISVDGEEYTDTQNDRIEAHELEKATTEFMLEARRAMVMHQRKDGMITDDLTKGSVVHSFPLTPDLMKSLEITSKKAGWIVGMKVADEEAWKGVKSGKYKSFSIGAKIKRRRSAEK